MSSTVVGHLKTILVIGLGWIVKREVVSFESAFGVCLAVLGIIGSVVFLSWEVGTDDYGSATRTLCIFIKVMEGNDVYV